MLPLIRDRLESPGVAIVAVQVLDCHNGYARVGAVPDNSRCQPDGSGFCYDMEQVFLRAVDGSWRYLTSGTGIACSDSDLGAELIAACRALGLRDR